jgi:hypothetical protein
MRGDRQGSVGIHHQVIQSIENFTQLQLWADPALFVPSTFTRVTGHEATSLRVS